MIRRLLAILFLSILGLSGLTACETTGRMTGEAAQEVEEGAEEFGEGYEEGKRGD